MIKNDHSFVGERRNELNDEERIATRLLVHQLYERRGGFRRAANSVRDQLRDMFSGERPKRDLVYPSASGLDRVEFAHEQMRASDFVIAIGADEEKIAQIGPAQQIFQEVERRRVEPLQVIEEERQRMFRPSEDTDEPPKHQLETPLRVLWRKLRDRRWLSDDSLHFRNEIHNQSGVRSQRFPQRVAPGRKLYFAFAEQRPDQALKGLCQSRVGNVAFVLIEFAGSEKAARWYQYRLQLIDDRGLTDPRIARDQDQFRGATVDDAIEGGEQGLNLALPPIEFLWDQQAVGLVLFAEWEVVYPTLRLPCGQASAKIAFEACDNLVAVFGPLREQLHDDRRDGAGDFAQPLGRRHRPPGEVAVHPFHGLGGGERQNTSKHLVKRDAEGVEVAAGIDGPIHPSRLLGRHIGERAGDRLGRVRRLALAQQA